MHKFLLYLNMFLLSWVIARAQVHNSHQAPRPSDFYETISALEQRGRNANDRQAVLRSLHQMWASYDVLRRPEIAYLMCQLGDTSEVEAISKAFFAGDYDTGREVDGDAAAGMNATDAAFRMLILYGTPKEHQGLLAFLKLPDDPLRKAGNLCETLLGLSSAQSGPGLPKGYPKEHFPLELAVACLDYTNEEETVVSAPNGSVVSQGLIYNDDSAEGSITVSGVKEIYTLRGCDHAAQAIQNITGKDFGYRPSQQLPRRNAAIGAIKKWWHEVHSTGSSEQ